MLRVHFELPPGSVMHLNQSNSVFLFTTSLTARSANLPLTGAARDRVWQQRGRFVLERAGISSRSAVTEFSARRNAAMTSGRERCRAVQGALEGSPDAHELEWSSR